MGKSCAPCTGPLPHASLRKLRLPAVTAPRKGPSDLIDAYLGLLYPTEDYKVSLGVCLLWQMLLKQRVPDMLEANAPLQHQMQLWLRCKGLDGAQVYGYISNTRMKFLLVLNEQASREDEIRLVRPHLLHCWTPSADRLHAAAAACVRPAAMQMPSLPPLSAWS